ncbi:MAG: thiamine-phosphate kinase [Acidobacteria bacterium]|nr:thiamine-phosphate kinase [Acidobacteriota bacterium]
MSTPSSVSDVGEHALIALIRDRVPPAPSWVAVGLGDDAAVVEPERNLLEVFTTDALVEGIHFDRAFTPPWAIGHRALAVNLSDVAAMGATPRLALLSLVLPPALPVTEFTALLDGLLALAACHRVRLVGGNITRSPGPLMVDITATGSVHRRRVLRRSGARPGDEVWVSGQLGAAAAGLASLQTAVVRDPAYAGCEAAFLAPEPRVRLGTLLGRNRAASACVDLSDGLADGLHQLAAASAVGIEVDSAAIPIAPAAEAWFTALGQDAVLAAVTGGDDYELLFTVSPRARRRFLTVRHQLGDLPLTRIGTVGTMPDVVWTREGRRERVPSGYVHFR